MGRGLRLLTTATSKNLAIIVCVWLFFLGLLGVLTYTNTGMGMNVWPIIEDHNFLLMLQNKPEMEFPRAFWALDRRNPLSPWWHMLCRNILVSKDGYGFFAIRKFTDLFLACCVYLFMNRVGRGRHPNLALCCGVMSLLWHMGPVYGSIVWNRHCAIGLTLISIAHYMRYVDESRRSAHWLASSILLYIIAIGTYTLLASSVISVFLIGMFRTPNQPSEQVSWLKRFWLTCIESAFYVAAFAIFWAIWMTTSPSGIPGKLQFSNITSALVPFFQQAIWPKENSKTLFSMASDWNTALLVAAAAGLFCFFGFVFKKLLSAEINQPSTDTSADSTREPEWKILPFALIGVMGIMASTMAVELTSPLFYPGTRSVMIQQTYIPIVFFSLVFLLTWGAQRHLWARRARWALATAGVTFACLLAFEHNRKTVSFTSIQQKKLLESVAPVVNETGKHLNVVVVFNDPSLTRVNPILANNFVKKHLADKNITPYFVLDSYFIRGFVGFTPIVLYNDDRGIYLDPQFKRKDPFIKYEDTVFIRYNGVKPVVMTKIIARSTVGFDMVFRRDKPLDMSIYPATQAMMKLMEYQGMPTSPSVADKKDAVSPMPSDQKNALAPPASNQKNDAVPNMADRKQSVIK